jgi:hypothetical protein
MASLPSGEGAKHFLPEQPLPPPKKRKQDETKTGIATKISDLESRIAQKQEEVNQKQEAVNQKQEEVNEKAATVDASRDARDSVSAEDLQTQLQLEREYSALKDELSALKDELLALERELLALERERSALKDELSALKIAFTEGRYFGLLNSYWKSEAVNVAQNAVYQQIKHCNYVRTEQEANEIQVRSYSGNKNYGGQNIYQQTREGAQDPQRHIVASKSARTSHQSQRDRDIRNTVWPTDIFGNMASHQDIANLLPAGKEDHKEWMHVAASLVGLRSTAPPNELKKAVRGFEARQEEKKKMDGTGVVHFVSAKLRMTLQQAYFDGEYPKAMLIPIMSLDTAKQWKGESYNALFTIGLPRMEVEKIEQQPNNGYSDVRMTSAMRSPFIRDATTSEVEEARNTLIQATLVLRDLISSMDMDGNQTQDLNYSKNSVEGLKQAQFEAQKAECLLPQAINCETDRKPLCLVTFGAFDEVGAHPPPDPLILAYKSANVWGKMVGRRLLANGEPFDPNADMTEEDYMAELAFLEARSGFKRPETWEDLAAGLGQPDGFWEE